MKSKYIFRFQNTGEDYLREIALKSRTMEGAFYEARATLDRAGRTLSSLEKIHIEEVKSKKGRSKPMRQSDGRCEQDDGMRRCDNQAKYYDSVKDLWLCTYHYRRKKQ